MPENWWIKLAELLSEAADYCDFAGFTAEGRDFTCALRSAEVIPTMEAGAPAHPGEAA